ncbi:MAG: sigma-70 family RNA polymerase sigma factor [Nocardioides sp.]
MRRQRRQCLEAELEEYFSARAVTLRRTAYLVVRDWHVAEDMVQATFVQLYLHWPRIRQETVDAYARRTLVNQCLSHLRRHRREHLTEHVPDTAALQFEAPLDLTAALALLPARQRAIVALRFLDDLSVAATAQTLDLAEGTVKSQTSRALETLRRHLPDLALTEEPR